MWTSSNISRCRHCLARWQTSVSRLTLLTFYLFFLYCAQMKRSNQNNNSTQKEIVGSRTMDLVTKNQLIGAYLHICTVLCNGHEFNTFQNIIRVPKSLPKHYLRLFFFFPLENCTADTICTLRVSGHPHSDTRQSLNFNTGLFSRHCKQTALYTLHLLSIVLFCSKVSRPPGTWLLYSHPVWLIASKNFSTTPRVRKNCFTIRVLGLLHGPPNATGYKNWIFDQHCWWGIWVDRGPFCQPA